MARSRLGVVLPVPGPASHEIRGLQRALGGGQRLPPHLTLVPPVNINDRELDQTLAIVRSAAGRTAPLEVRLGPPATFWPDTPVVYLAVGGDVAGVRRLRDAVFAGPLTRPLTWPFVPHVTLAEEPSAIGLVEALGRFGVDVVLDRVQVLRERSGWEVLVDVALGGARIVARGGLELELTTGTTVDPDAASLAGRGFVVTARRSGEVVGVARGRIGVALWLDDLVVGPWGEGVGTHLLHAVELLGAEAGCGEAVSAMPVAGWLRERGWREDPDRRVLHRSLGRGDR